MRLWTDPHRRTTAAFVVIGLVVVALVWIAGAGGRDRPETRVPAPTPIRSTVVAKAPATPVDAGTPHRLVIPAIATDAPIESVGTTSGGAQDVPRSIDSTGWWRDGSRPGQSGNAVIVGHTAHAAEGVFNDLGALRRGDAISVQSRHGIVRFEVTRTRDVEVAAFDTIAPAVYRRSGTSGLVLMTCGDWNGRHFETTTIVFARLVRS